MKTKLDNLLEEIHPDVIYNQIGKPMDEAFANYPIQSSTVSSFDELQEVLVDAYCVFIDTSPDVYLTNISIFDFHFAKVWEILTPALGDTHFREMMVYGIDGGVYEVLKTLAREMERKASESLIKIRISSYWNNLTSTEKQKAPFEYYKKYKFILPQTPGFIKDLQLEKIFLDCLEKHPFVLAIHQKQNQTN